MTKSSTRTIWTMNLTSRFLTASTSAWTQAKLPMIRKSRKSQRSTPVASGTWSLPARSARSPTRLQAGRDEAASPRSERYGVGGEPRAPGGGDAEERRKEQQDTRGRPRPAGRRVEEKADQDLLEPRQPGDRRRGELRDPAPRLRECGDEPVNHLSPP